MTYDQLTPIYQQQTGKVGSDAAFNQWVQQLIDSSGSSNGIQGIPDNYVQLNSNQNVPGGGTYGTASQPTPVTGTGGNAVAGTVVPPIAGNTNMGSGDTSQGTGGIDFGALTQAGTPPAITPNTLPALNTLGGNYGTNQTGAQTGGYTSVGGTSSNTSGSQDTNTTGSQNTTGTQTGATTGSQVGNTTGATTGATTGTSAQNTVDNSQQTTAGTTNQTSLDTGQSSSTGGSTNSGTQATTGTTSGTTGVNAPFDVGALVNSTLGTDATTDANRSSFLNDFMNTGGTALNSQVDQAVRQSLSGPQAVGAGDSAQARAAGYSAAQIARNNADQRLQAASELAGPTATGSTVASFAPLFGTTSTGTNTGNTTTANTGTTTGNTTNVNAGQTGTSTAGTTTGSNTGSTTGSTTGTSAGTTAGTSNLATGGTSTGSTTGASNTAGTSNTLDLQSLLSNEGQAGTAIGNSLQQAGGLVPQGQPTGSSGCVVCTAFVARGQMKPGAIRRAVRWKLGVPKYATSIAGYMLYGPFLARLVLHSDVAAYALRSLARAILYHEVFLACPNRLRWKLKPWLCHAAFNCLSWPVGLLSQWLGLDTGVRCPQIRALLKSQNLDFPYESR